METMIRDNWRSARRITDAEARKWFLPDQEDFFQEVLTRLVRYPPKLETARDPEDFFFASLRRASVSTALKLKGLQDPSKGRPQSAKAIGEQATHAVGLFRTIADGEDDSNIMDERILPFMASAEDVFFSSLPNPRKERLRAAIDALPERQRVALTHQVYEELSVADSARLMNLTTAQVQSARFEGTKTLKSVLNPKGFND